MKRWLSEQIAGAFDAGLVQASGKATEVYATGTPEDLCHSIEVGDVDLVDVRSLEEWNAGHIEQASHRFLGRLPMIVDQLPGDKKIVVQCRSGARSAIGVSVLQAAGIKDVVNLTGGYMAWKSTGLPSVKLDPALVG